jgi:hypothetical protein
VLCRSRKRGRSDTSNHTTSSHSTSNHTSSSHTASNHTMHSPNMQVMIIPRMHLASYYVQFTNILMQFPALCLAQWHMDESGCAVFWHACTGILIMSAGLQLHHTCMHFCRCVSSTRILMQYPAVCQAHGHMMHGDALHWGQHALGFENSSSLQLVIILCIL